MSYTGESYNGKKWVSSVGAANQFVTLDNIMVKIKPGANDHKVQIKTVSGSVLISGPCLAMQGTTLTAPFVYQQTITNSAWVDLLPANIYGLAGSTQRILIRTNNSASNQGIYMITANAGNLIAVGDFDKYGFTLERLA